MRTLRSTVLSAALLPILLLTAACNDDKSSDGDAAAAGAQGGSQPATSKASASAGGGKVLTSAQLQGVLLGANDLGSDWQASPDGVGADQKETVVNEDCQALIGLLSPLSGAVAPTGQAVGQFAKTDMTQLTTLRLTSFAAADAEKVMRDAESGLEQCHVISAKGADGAMLSYVVTKLSAPTLGERAVAFSAAVSDGHDNFKVAVTALRSGSTIETIANMAVEGNAAQPDQALVKKQLDKLAAAS